MICGMNLIKQYLDETSENRKSIKITCTDENAPNFDPESQVGRDSIDLRIGSKGYKIKCDYDYINTLSSDIDTYFEDIEILQSGYMLYPGETIIVSTVEKIKLTGDIMGEIVGRTRFARMGLSVCSSTKFQSYSNAIVVLQISNHNRVPLKIFPYQKLAQIIIHEVKGMPNEARGNYSNESKLEKPLIRPNELVNFDERQKTLIEKQVPTKDPYKDGNGNKISDKRISDNNRKMSSMSRWFAAISTIASLLIGILCSFGILNVTLITSLAFPSAVLTVTSVIIDGIKDNNFIE